MNILKKHSLFFCNKFGYFLFTLILASSAILGIWYFIFQTNFFEIDNFKILGSELGQPDQIKTATIATLLQDFKLKFLFQPDNILFWYLNQGAITIAPIDPFIAQINISASSLFSRKKEVALETKEKDLYGIWCGDNDCLVFDKDGLLFYPVAEAEGVLITKIKDFSGRTLTSGQKILPNDLWIKNIFKIVEIIKESGFPIVYLKINNLDLREWGAVLPNNLTLYFSLEFMPDNFANVFKNLTKKIELNKTIYLDFRVPNRIYYK